VFEGDRHSIAHASPASGSTAVRSIIRHYEQALAHMAEPPLPDARFPGTALFTTVLEYPSHRIGHDSRSIRSRANGIRVATVLRFQLSDGSERVFTFSRDPGSCGWIRVVPGCGRFVALGFEHILSGIDHLLFLCVSTCCRSADSGNWR
jgi:hypothetical protein